VGASIEGYTLRSLALKHPPTVWSKRRCILLRRPSQVAAHDALSVRAGVVWSLWWEWVMRDIAAKDPEVGAQLLRTPQQQRQQLKGTGHGAPGGRQVSSKSKSRRSSNSSSGHGANGEGEGGEGEGGLSVSWQRLLANVPLRALMYTHFCNNWCHYTFLVSAERI
jgi:hypothetical protein